jgi:uncharacterized protein YndB with AHSA1/START domain
VSKATFVYVVYIATSPEKAWQALTEGEVTRQYWGYENVSDWKVGSKWEHRRADGSPKPLLVGQVIEIKPPRRLVLTWAAPEDAADRAKHTRVTFELEPIEKMVRLTVTHDELVAGSDMHRSISEGWPRVLSSLKSFLETGRPLDTWAKASHQ